MKAWDTTCEGIQELHHHHHSHYLLTSQPANFRIGLVYVLKLLVLGFVLSFLLRALSEKVRYWLNNLQTAMYANHWHSGLLTQST